MTDEPRTDDWYVLVIETATGKEEKRLGPMSAHKADKVENGILRNLDYEHFYTSVEPSPHTHPARS